MVDWGLMARVLGTVLGVSLVGAVLIRAILPNCP